MQDVDNSVCSSYYGRPFWTYSRRLRIAMRSSFVQRVVSIIQRSLNVANDTFTYDIFLIFFCTTYTLKLFYLVISAYTFAICSLKINQSIYNVLFCTVMLIWRLTKEGETIPLCQYPLDLETETCRQNSNSFVFLVWPATVVHRINSSSPLWDISAEQMLTEQFEIIVILEGKQEIHCRLFYVLLLCGSCL